MEKDVEKVLAVLSYPIPIIGLILALVSSSSYGKVNGWQGFFWGVFFLLGHIILRWALFFGGLLSQLFSLFWLVFAIIFAVRAWKGETVTIPVISDLAQKLGK